jgi:hypothetical protein
MWYDQPFNPVMRFGVNKPVLFQNTLNDKNEKRCYFFDMNSPSFNMALAVVLANECARWFEKRGRVVQRQPGTKR